MSIPKIVHQTWRQLPTCHPYDYLTNSWQQQHPGWDYRFWSDADLERLVTEHYPSLWPVFDRLELAIEKADVGRYLILHRHGGVYADIDMECLQPLGRHLHGTSLLLSREPSQHYYAEIGGVPLSNALLASVPGHPLWAQILERLHRLDPYSADPAMVLERTGPIMLTRALRRLDEERYDMRVLDAALTTPYQAWDWRLSLLLNDKGCDLRNRLRDKGVVTVHYWFNTWAHTPVPTTFGPLAGETNYTFYPGLDSPGHDILRSPLDLQTVMRISEQRGAAAFNTAGFVKRRLRPREDWTEWLGASDTEGLYVRNALHFGGPFNPPPQI